MKSIHPTETNSLWMGRYDTASVARRFSGSVDIQHAIDLAAMFQSHGVKAHAVWGDDPARADKIAAPEGGDIADLTNCGVLTEGYDDPEVSCIVTARPTKSSLLFQQMVGRGTRLETGVENRLTHPTPLRKPNC